MDRTDLFIGMLGFALAFVVWLLYRKDELVTPAPNGGSHFHARPTVRAFLIFFASCGVAIIASGVRGYRDADDLGVMAFGLLFAGVAVTQWPRGITLDAEGMREYRVWGKQNDFAWSDYLRREEKRTSQVSSSGHWFYFRTGKLLVYDAYYDTDRLIELVDQMSGKSGPHDL